MKRKTKSNIYNNEVARELPRCNLLYPSMLSPKITVCAEVDDDVKVKYENFKQYHKKGLADIIENFELYALSWDDVFQAFEAKHDFMLSKLKLDYSQVAADLGLGLEQLDSKDAVTDATNKILALSGQ